MFNIKLEPQEQPCGARFNNQVVMTKGFNELFEPFSSLIALTTLQKIIKERVNSKEEADYLQVAMCQDNKFWVIDDGSYVTFLLPSEY
ncbi:hypothetical protein SAMN05660462_02473 [Proteiniborus ethanoligenes]|uniref:Uncharacterized protein n=2 Tax=Proteiniborus ethanoligenes TaxID=415015 RepID=A0A1H3RPJ1_9FIRM|nr:hypothetical protein SAMN05660462_02473 [Proteiniborus ethanoligenes]